MEYPIFWRLFAGDRAFPPPNLDLRSKRFHQGFLLFFKIQSRVWGLFTVEFTLLSVPWDKGGSLLELDWIENIYIIVVLLGYRSWPASFVVHMKMKGLQKCRNVLSLLVQEWIIHLVPCPEGLYAEKGLEMHHYCNVITYWRLQNKKYFREVVCLDYERIPMEVVTSPSNGIIDIQAFLFCCCLLPFILTYNYAIKPN